MNFSRAPPRSLLVIRIYHHPWLCYGVRLVTVQAAGLVWPSRRQTSLPPRPLGKCPQTGTQRGKQSSLVDLTSVNDARPPDSLEQDPHSYTGERFLVALHRGRNLIYGKIVGAGKRPAEPHRIA